MQKDAGPLRRAGKEGCVPGGRSEVHLPVSCPACIMGCQVSGTEISLCTPLTTGGGFTKAGSGMERAECADWAQQEEFGGDKT